MAGRVKGKGKGMWRGQYKRKREEGKGKEGWGDRTDEKAKKAMEKATSHPRIAHGQRYLMPCFK